MKWEQNRCPTCGEPARSTTETVPGEALLQYQVDTDSFEYEGETKIWWDGQASDLDAEGRNCLRCANDHEWWSNPIQEREGPYPYPGDVAARDVL